MRSIPLATAQEVLLVDGFEEARHCPWQELVFDCGDAQRTLRAIPFGNRVASDEFGPVPFLLQALDEAVHVLFQVWLVCLGAYLIHPRGGILPDGPLALREEVLIEHPIEVAKPIALVTFRLLRSSLQGGWHWGSDPAWSGHVSWAGSVCLSAPSLCARLSRLGVL